MLPGRKQRIEIPDAPFTGHTMVGRAIWHGDDSIVGTSIHWPSSDAIMTSFDSQSTSETAEPSASEQHSPFPLLRLSNQGFERRVGVAAIITGRSTSGEDSGRGYQRYSGSEKFHAARLRNTHFHRNYKPVGAPKFLLARQI